MQNEPVSVRKSFIAVMSLFVIMCFIVAGLLSSALKQKKEKEQVAPIGNHKVMSATVPAHQDQVVSHGNVVIVRDQGASFSMLPSSTSAPTHFVSEAELRQKQRR